MELKTIKVPKKLWQQLKTLSLQQEISIPKVIDRVLNKKEENGRSKK